MKKCLFSEEKYYITFEIITARRMERIKSVVSMLKKK